MGASAGLAARRRGLARRVVGFSRKHKTLEEARRMGAIDSFETNLEKAAEGADFVLVSVPVASIAERVIEVSRADLEPGAIITDVGSVKGPILKIVEKDPIARKLFVGSHPIAGTEKSGPGAAFSKLYEGRRCVVTPTSKTDPHRAARVKKFWKDLGMEVEALSPAEHDRLLAVTSHAPHVIAYALALAAGSDKKRAKKLARYVGGGFKDTTRIAASSPQMWREIIEANAKAVDEAVLSFLQELLRMNRAITHGRWGELEKLFEQAARFRRSLDPAKKGRGR